MHSLNNNGKRLFPFSFEEKTEEKDVCVCLCVCVYKRLCVLLFVFVSKGSLRASQWTSPLSSTGTEKAVEVYAGKDVGGKNVDHFILHSHPFCVS